MKFLSILATALCAATALAAPFASSELQERKPNSTPVKLSSKPAKGTSGVWHDHSTGITHVHYGDDLPVHAAHLQYHNKKYPQHDGMIFKPAAGGRKEKGTEFYNNGEAAIGDLSKLPAGSGHVRDEKPWASLSHGAKHTSVVKAPESESRVESVMAKVAKEQHQNAAESGAKAQGIMLHDHRTNKTPLDTNKYPILKEMRRRSVESDVGKLETKTESSLKNDTAKLLSGLEHDFAKLQSKLSGIIEPVIADLEGAGGDIIGFVKQALFPADHQLGVFWGGYHGFDSVWNYTAQHDPSSMCNDTLAQDAAAINVYSSAYQNTTALLPNNYQDIIATGSGYTSQGERSG